MDGQWKLCRKEQLQLDRTQAEQQHHQHYPPPAGDLFISSIPSKVERESEHGTIVNGESPRPISVLNTPLASIPPQVGDGKRKQSPELQDDEFAVPSAKCIAIYKRSSTVTHIDDDSPRIRTQAIFAEHSLAEQSRRLSIDDETLAYYHKGDSYRTIATTELMIRRRISTPKLAQSVSSVPQVCQTHNETQNSTKSQTLDNQAH